MDDDMETFNTIASYMFMLLLLYLLAMICIYLHKNYILKAQFRLYINRFISIEGDTSIVSRLLYRSKHVDYIITFSYVCGKYYLINEKMQLYIISRCSKEIKPISYEQLTSSKLRIYNNLIAIAVKEYLSLQYDIEKVASNLQLYDKHEWVYVECL